MIVVIDYGMGNIRSVQKGFEKVGARAVISSSPEDVASADKIVLPGVGAFGDAVDGLEKRGLLTAVVRALMEGKPFLGMCLGLQLLFTRSYEGGEFEGLGILQGKVVRFPGADMKVPHMGWNRIVRAKECPLLDGVPDGTHMYFAHSYYVVPDDADVTATTTLYGVEFASSVYKDNMFATQFHPEKSQRHGLRILKNFAES